jgi:hypothetical protein
MTRENKHMKMRFVDKGLLDMTIGALLAILVAASVVLVIPQSSHLTTRDLQRKEGIVNGVLTQADRSFLSGAERIIPVEIKQITTDTDIVLLGKAIALDVKINKVDEKVVVDMLSINGFTHANAKKFVELSKSTY